MKIFSYFVFLLMFALQTTHSQEYKPDPNTVALYHFNETDGSAVNDVSGNNNNGTASGTTVVDGKFGKARHSSGQDHIVIPNSPSLDLQDQFTIEAWVSMDGMSGEAGVILDKGSRGNRNYVLGIIADGRISAGTHNSNGEVLIYVPYTMQQNKFYHLAAVADGMYLSLFVDGIKIGQVDASGPYTKTGDLGIGYNIGNSDYYFQGTIDEIRISNKAREPWEFNYPVVQSVSPAKNALNISKSTNISIEFNVPMNPTTLTTNNVLVYGSQSGKHTGTITLSGDNAFTFNPSSDFMSGEIVNVILTKNILSSSGDNLTNGYHWSFTTATAPSLGTFSSKVDYPTGGNPVSVFVYDLDGDGDGDLVVANRYDNTVSILKNNGDGTFAAKQDYPTGAAPWSVFVCDIDNDGDGDLAVANLYSNTVSILKNNGDGTFATKADYVTGTEPSSIFISDLNGDGYGDLVVANMGSDNVSVLMNNGDGTFATKVDYLAGDGPYSLFVTDLDGDGDGDIAVSNDYANTVSILKNNGNGTFTAKVDYTVGTTPNGIFVSDLDSDGDGDIVVTDFNSDSVSILMNNGDGTFAPRVNYATGPDPNPVFVSDVDGDGGPDLVINSYPNNVSILKNNGNGTFAPKVDNTVGAGPSSVFVSDLNGDGYADIVATNWGSYTVSILMNNYQPPTGSISGTVFNDVNANGVRDAGEPGLQGWTVSLTGQASTTTQTNANGEYLFTNLQAGTYIVSEVLQQGWTRTEPVLPSNYSVTLSQGQNATGKDFGNIRNGTTIITHGFRGIRFTEVGIPKWREYKWMFSMADAISPDREICLIRKGITYKLKDDITYADLKTIDGMQAIDNVVQTKFDRIGSGPATLNENRQVVFVFDWVEESNLRALGYAEGAADVLSAALIENAIQYPWLLKRLHFIGHSRGCVVNSECIERLMFMADNGLLPTGVNLDKNIHMTTLDPHPVNHWSWNPLGKMDDDYVNSANIMFEDKRIGVVGWRLGEYSTSYIDNFYETQDIVRGLSDYPGLTNTSSHNLDQVFNVIRNGTEWHRLVHAWYFGTVDHNIITTKDEFNTTGFDLDRANWYIDQIGFTQGFYYSLLRGGDLSTIVSSSDLIDVNSDRNYGIDYSLFNGRFKMLGWKVTEGYLVPGWTYQGGNGVGKMGHNYLILDNDRISQTHNRFFVPNNVSKIYYQVKIKKINKRNPNDILKILVDESVRATIPLKVQTTDFGTGWISITGDINKVKTLTFKLESNDEIESVVYIDNVGFSDPLHNTSITEEPPNQDNESSKATSYSLDYNYPNPFNPMTNIIYNLPTQSKVTLKILNTLGQVVATLMDNIQDEGYQLVQWDASNVASGIYFYRLEAVDVSNPGNNFVQIRKMILLK